MSACRGSRTTATIVHTCRVAQSSRDTKTRRFQSSFVFVSVSSISQQLEWKDVLIRCKLGSTLFCFKSSINNNSATTSRTNRSGISHSFWLKLRYSSGSSTTEQFVAAKTYVSIEINLSSLPTLLSCDNSGNDSASLLQTATIV
ncbi:unnamed protein product [Lathyrus sativus]|nr:unnamed protein product [Lathyrus sativus]